MVSTSPFYDRLLKQAQALWSDESDPIAILSNVSALLNIELDKINWVGFYLYRDPHLVLGPFQGKPACYRIDLGKGVCGTAAATRTTQRVTNVHEFPGHIACDAASNAEIVIPLIVNNELFGVLDIDSPQIDRFDLHDETGLEALAVALQTKLQQTPSR